MLDDPALENLETERSIRVPHGKNLPGTALQPLLSLNLTSYSQSTIILGKTVGEMDSLSIHDDEVKGSEGWETPKEGNSFTSENIDEHAPLCSECKAIFDNWHERDNWSSARPGHSHHHFGGLQSSAKKGCPVCAMFLSELSPSTTKTLLEDRKCPKSLVIVEDELQLGTYSIKLTFSGNDEMVTVYAWASVNDDHCGKVKEHADDEENWVLIRKWLNICQQSHPKCTQKFVERELPTRLVDVGDTAEELKICETHSLDRETQYMTLSHCWGSKVFTTLTPDNFQSFFCRIPYEDLSKTFKEAILITRRLGFRYLWIDSLCIKQGDEVDWRHESARMMIVYSNSALNIAASAAPDGSFGCFTPRMPNPVYGCKIAILETHRQPRIKVNIWDIARGALLNDFKDHVLRIRGWIFQEIFLAPRTLYFKSHQLVWECTSTKACETFPNSYSQGHTLPAIKSVVWNDPSLNVGARWISTVTQYSSTKTTFRRDKLIALSGIARLFAVKYGLTYLAGLWKEYLIEQLAWEALEPSNNDDRDTIPSWSWASVDTLVLYAFALLDNNPNPNPLASILEATTFAVDDEFGEVRGGTMRIRCRLPFIAHVVWQDKELMSWSVVQSQVQVFESFLAPDRTRYHVGQELYFLPLLGRGRRQFGETRGICGLVVDPIRPGSYRRTGYFRVAGEYDTRAVEEAQKIATYEDKYFIGEPLGLDEDGQKMCIITLI